MQPGKITKCCRLTRLRVKGFKSLRDTIIDFPTGLTILVGPNGSGKTALIESLLLLRDVLDFLRGRVVNPFLRWWGYSNVAWMHDETKPVEIDINLDCSRCDIRKMRSLIDNELNVPLSGNVKYVAAGIEYGIIVSGAGGAFSVLGEKLCIKGLSCLELKRELVQLRLKPEAIIDMAKNFLRDAIHSLSARLINEEQKYVNAINRCLKYLEEANEEGIASQIAKYLSGLKIRLDLPYVRESLLKLYADKLYEKSDMAELSLMLSMEVTESILRKILSLIIAEDKIKQYMACLSSLTDSETAHKITSGLVTSTIEWIMDNVLLVVFTAILLVGYFVDRIVVLRLLDYRSLRSPQPLETGERLREDGSNLVSVIFRLGRGRFPDDIGAVLSSVLGAESVSGFFEPTPDGRLVLKLVVDNVELAPPSIPEGAWKTMALMSAVLSGASVVAVDEFENSLHASAQELLLEELRQGAPSAIVATHSPVVVDAAKSLDEIALAELEAGETKIHRPRDPGKLAEKLRELGVTPSEALLYGLLETS